MIEAARSAVNSKTTKLHSCNFIVRMLYIHIDYSLFLFYFYVLLYRLRFVNFIINEHDDDDDGDWYTGRWWVGCYIWYNEEGPGRATARPSLRCTKCNSPPNNGQSTNFILFNEAPWLPLQSRGLTASMCTFNRQGRYENVSWWYCYVELDVQ